MHKIIIIGAGFSGLSAASRLSKLRLDIEILVFDKKGTTDFLPLIPDAIGRALNPDFLVCHIQDILPKQNIRFVKKEIVSVNLETRQVFTVDASYTYDFLVIASGSQVNFFSDSQAKNLAYAVNSVNDVKKIISALQENEFENFIICGGGYTGIEAATNLCLFCRKNGIAGKIVIVERSPEILGPLPGWMKAYVKANLEKLGIDVLTNSTVENI